MRRLALVAAVAVLAYFLFSLAALGVQEYQLSQRSALVEADISRMQSENQRLQNEVKRMQTDAAVDGLARAQLGFAKDDETTVVVDFGPGGPPKTPATPTPTPVPNWRQWANLLTGQ